MASDCCEGGSVVHAWLNSAPASFRVAIGTANEASLLRSGRRARLACVCGFLQVSESLAVIDGIRNILHLYDKILRILSCLNRCSTHGLHTSLRYQRVKQANEKRFNHFAFSFGPRIVTVCTGQTVRCNHFKRLISAGR